MVVPEGTPAAYIQQGRLYGAEYAGQREGMLISLEAAATLAAYHRLLMAHIVQPGDETVLFFTGSGLSDVGNMSL